MFAVTTNTCVFKSILLFVLVIVAFVIFYTFTVDNGSLAQSLGTSVRVDRTPTLKIKSNNDRFSNLDVNNLLALETPYPSGIVPTSVLADYDKLITPDFRTRLDKSGANAEAYYKHNDLAIVTKLNEMDGNIKKMLTDVNNKLYKQLGDNYARSQEINSIRQDWLQDIDELPYKVLV
jgi:hypothetical protein